MRSAPQPVVLLAEADPGRTASLIRIAFHNRSPYVVAMQKYLVPIVLMLAVSYGCDKKEETATVETEASAVTAAAPAKAETPDDKCKKAEACKKYGDCSWVRTQCAPGTDADCKDSDYCKNDGRCKALNGMCVKPE